MGEPLHSRAFSYLMGAMLALASELGVARAEPSGDAPTFSWDAPESCPNQELSLAELERLLGHPVARDLSTDKVFAVKVVRLPTGGFRAKLLVTSGTEQGERTVDHDDCEQLAKVVALVVALTIDPEAVRERQETRPESGGIPTQEPGLAPCRCECPLNEGMWQQLVDASTPCPALSCPAPQPCRPYVVPPRSGPTLPRATPHPEAAPPFRWFLEAGFGAASGVLPELGPTVSADVGLELDDRWRVELDGRYWVRQKFSPEDYPSVQTSQRMLSGGARLCGIPFSADWRLVGCAGPELGDYRAASLAGVSEGSVQRGRWFAILGSLGAYFPLSSELELGTRVDGGPVLTRPAVGATGADGEWVKLSEPQAFVANFGVTLLFRGQGAD